MFSVVDIVILPFVVSMFRMSARRAEQHHHGGYVTPRHRNAEIAER
jgi:hypothetical protein